jgi:hypothetical protein
VQQPQGAAWDPSASDEDIFTATQTQFRDEPGFSPIERYYQTRRETLQGRQA